MAHFALSRRPLPTLEGGWRTVFTLFVPICIFFIRIPNLFVTLFVPNVIFMRFLPIQFLVYLRL